MLNNKNKNIAPIYNFSIFHIISKLRYICIFDCNWSFNSCNFDSILNFNLKFLKIKIKTAD